MNSMIYNGRIAHERHWPVNHRFQYPLYFYGLDLDELPELDRRLPMFGYNRLRPASVFDSDYLDARAGSIREKLFGFLADQGKGDGVESILLVTSPRYFNYVFNPVSFYFCMDARGKFLTVVVEVNNTFGDRHVYIPEAVELSGTDGGAHFRTDKAFHVSPFNDMAGRYEFWFARPGDFLDIRIELTREEFCAFEARLRGQGVPFTPWNHFRMMLSHPLRPHLTMPRILLQAARLYLQKHLSYHPRPAPVSPMTIRTRK